jgi:hypothetical protein
MTERWQRELRGLRTVEMPPTVRDRIDGGPTGTSEPPGRSRVTAAVVAFAVFAAAGAFAWRALGPGEPDGPVPPLADVPRVVVTLNESEEFDNYPTGTLTFEDTTVEAAIGSFGWCDEDGSCGIADVTLPEFDEYVPIPVGSEVVVQTSAVRVRASLGDPRYPFENAVEIELTEGTGTLEGELGRHGLVFDVRWEDGETYLEAPLYFPIELVEQAVTDPSPSEEPPISSQLYEASTTILESREHGPELCLGGVADSYPPQCGGVPIADWDWDLVDGEESASGTTWGNFHVVGTYDGSTFTVSEAGPYEQSPSESTDFTAPCPEPAGGWIASDPDRATDADLQNVMRAAEHEPDSAGFWIDYVGEPSEFATTQEIIAVAAFTGDLERHEAELRELWGGPLCVTRHEHTLRDLMRIQAELGSEIGLELGLQTTWSSVDIVENEVEFGVVVADDEMRAAIDARYGPGTVRLFPALTPIAH